MDAVSLYSTSAGLWDELLPSLADLVAIPAVSAAFDRDWQRTGQLRAAVEHVRNWMASRALAGVTAEVIELPGKSPLLVVDVPASDDGDGTDTVLFYGHLDKQPPMAGWSDGLDPWSPVVRGGRLYGRGSADDGYSGYAAMAAIEAVRRGGGSHTRCVLLLETGEESGSPDLPEYLVHLRERLGAISLVICLDSGAGDYERLWLTTSLRGMLRLDVTVRVLESGQHSGMASGVAPSSFRVWRILLDRLENAATGELLLPELNAAVPADRMAEIVDTAATIPGSWAGSLPLAAGVRPVSTDDVELCRNNTWRPTLSVIGADGLPTPREAGNVLRAATTLCLSVRLPPTVDPDRGLEAVRTALTTEVPYGARVDIDHTETGAGWNAPTTPPWLADALEIAGEEVFGAPWRALGVGGSIPFMGLLQRAYPDAAVVVTGVLGPASNAHVPDESLDLGYATKLTTAIARILHAHARRGPAGDQAGDQAGQAAR